MATLILVPALLTGLLLTLGARRLIRAEAIAHMTALAESKATELQTAALHWPQDARLLTRRPSLRAQVHRLATASNLTRAARQQLETSLRSQLEDLVRPHGTAPGGAVVVALKNGQVLAETGATSARSAQAHAAAYTHTVQSFPGVPWLSDVYPDPDTHRPLLDVVQVIPPPDGVTASPAAALIWQIPLDREVAPALEQRQGLGETGEMVLVDHTGLVLKELRYEPGAVLKKVIHTDPVRFALAGEIGTKPLRDYRGVPVLAAYRRIPATGWGLVVKQDLAEADIGVTRLLGLWGISTAVLLLVGLIVAERIATRLAQPLLDLSAVARRIAAGDLDARAALDRGDELGRLAADLNQMADELARHRRQLEDELEVRIQELQATGDQLRQAEAEREEAEATLVGYQEDLRSLAAQVSSAEEKARGRIATELHDTVLQHLALAKLKLGLLKSAAGAADQTRSLQEMERLVQDGIESGRALLSNLNSSVPLDGGLPQAVAGLAEEVQQRHGLPVRVSADADLSALSDDQRLLGFQIVRELLMNVVKHAQARQATISLQRSDHALRLEVVDDGVGFDPDLCLSGLRAEGGFGLRSLADRLRPLGGSLEVHSAPGQGTRVTVLLPIVGA